MGEQTIMGSHVSPWQILIYRHKFYQPLIEPLRHEFATGLAKEMGITQRRKQIVTERLGAFEFEARLRRVYEGHSAIVADIPTELAISVQTRLREIGRLDGLSVYSALYEILKDVPWLILPFPPGACWMGGPAFMTLDDSLSRKLLDADDEFQSSLDTDAVRMRNSIPRIDLVEGLLVNPITYVLWGASYDSELVRQLTQLLMTTGGHTEVIVEAMPQADTWLGDTDGWRSPEQAADPSVIAEVMKGCLFHRPPYRDEGGVQISHSDYYAISDSETLAAMIRSSSRYDCGEVTVMAGENARRDCESIGNAIMAELEWDHAQTAKRLSWFASFPSCRSEDKIIEIVTTDRRLGSAIEASFRDRLALVC